MRSEAVRHVMNYFGLSQRRSCKVTCSPRSTIRYLKRNNDDDLVVNMIHEVVNKHPRYGCEMVHLKIRQRGYVINHKRTERLYKQEGLQLQKRKRRKKQVSLKRVIPKMPKQPGQIWSIDFMFDLANTKRLKILTVIDPATNESPLVWVDFSITGIDVISSLKHAISIHGKPKAIRCDNGPEFAGMDFDKWCFENRIDIHFSRPGKPVDNCYVESFNSRLRDECLNVNYFSSLTDARKRIEKWRVEFNTERPQKRFKGLTPSEYKRTLLIAEN